MILKNDIKSLPFQLLDEMVEDAVDSAMAERLQAIRGVIEDSNRRKISTYYKDVAQYFDPEAGSDGIEEYVKESVNLPDPAQVELNKDQRTECRTLARKPVIESFVASNNLGSKYTWVLPQITAKIGSWEPVKNDSGKYDGLLTLAKNCKEDKFNRGIYLTIQYSKRSALIEGKDVRLYKVGEYNNLVPLFLNAFKTYQNIPYSAWDKKNLNLVVDEDLHAAMTTTLPELTTDEIIELRNDGLMYKTGEKKGVVRNPQTAAMLYGIKDHPKWGPILGDQPKLALIMLAQIWCAHPSNRTHHMVLDPSNWDLMPAPILSIDPIKEISPYASKRTKKAKEVDYDLPW